MIWFWLGFFALVAVLLALDLGVLHRKQVAPSLKSAAGWTVVWMSLGFAFAGVVYLMYEHHWLGATLLERDPHSHAMHPAARQGQSAALTYVSAFLLEYALSIDNIFVISLLFGRFKVKTQFQHRVLFWGILGAIVFRVSMLSGGAFLAKKFEFLFYVFGAYLAYQGVKLLRGEDDDDNPHDNSPVVRFLRRYIRIVNDDSGRFTVRIDGRRALTMVAICLISIELTDVVFALDSIPAVLSVSDDVFIMVTSNIFAILGLRTLYFVLAGAMDKFQHLKIALAILLILVGAKLALHNHIHIPNAISLAVIAGIIGIGVLTSVFSSDTSDASDTETAGDADDDNATGGDPAATDETSTPESTGADAPRD